MIHNVYVAEKVCSLTKVTVITCTCKYELSVPCYILVLIWSKENTVNIGTQKKVKLKH